jgi:adhesin transport system membrane fusion protein
MTKSLLKSRVDERLTRPLILEDGRPPHVISATLYTFTGFVLAAVALGAITNVQEVANAPGQIAPHDQVQAVQHLEGGIVSEILVREGALVEAGQPLVRLEPAAMTSDRNQLESRRGALQLLGIRLDAESREEVPDFGALATSFPNLAAEQLDLYTKAIGQRRKERATLSARIAQRRSELAIARDDLETAQLQHEVQLEQFGIQKELVAKGLVSRKMFLEAKSQLQRAKGEASHLQGKLVTLNEAVSEAEGALAEADANALRKIAEEKTKAANELAEVEQSLIKSSDRVTRLVVRAPSNGTVHDLAPRSPGEVIKPGDVIARIVPSGQYLVAEVRINPRDGGHVAPDARANIRFSAFDSALYGNVGGVVEHVSASTFNAPPGQPALPGQTAGEPYYRAIIRLDRSTVGVGALSRQIVPGMVVQAQIITGSKSIIRYMLKPVFNSMDVAFTER